MSETLDDLPKALRTHASWLINAGAEDTRSSLANMTGTDDEMRILRAAIATEYSKQARPSRLNPMEAKLRKFGEAARTALLAAKTAKPENGCPTDPKPESPLARRARELREAKAEPEPEPTHDVEIVTTAEGTRADLRAAAQRINHTIDLIKGHEEAFEGATLEHRLCIGLEIAKAQEAFGMTRAESASLGGHAKAALSTVDTAGEKPAALASNPLGFSNWIKKETPDLPRPTAIRYARAFSALGLSHEEATPARIQAKIKDLNHHSDKASLPRPSLASLVKQAPKLPKPENLTVIVPQSSKQLKLEDARETYHLWMEHWDKALKHGHLENLDKKGLDQLKEFTATVRDRINARLAK